VGVALGWMVGRLVRRGWLAGGSWASVVGWEVGCEDGRAVLVVGSGVWAELGAAVGVVVGW